MIATKTNGSAPRTDRTKLPKNYIILPVPLPLGKTRKIKTGKLCYHHCKDLLGGWDMLRVLNDTYFECGNCKPPSEAQAWCRCTWATCSA
jgi:hypothetical protein